MGEITHKMAKANNINDTSKMSPINSAGIGCHYYFPMDENAVGAINDMSSASATFNPAGPTPPANAVGTSPYTMEINCQLIAPTTGDVSVTIPDASGIVLFGMYNLSTDPLGNGDARWVVRNELGNPVSAGLGFDWENKIFKIFGGLDQDSTTFDIPEIHKLANGILIAAIVSPRDLDGGFTVEMVLFDGSENTGSDRTILNDSGKADILDIGPGGLVCSNFMSMGGYDFTGTFFNADKYLAGIQSFKGGVPTTIYDDLLLMQQRAITGKKGLPANWLFEG